MVCVIIKGSNDLSGQKGLKDLRGRKWLKGERIEGSSGWKSIIRFKKDILI